MRTRSSSNRLVVSSNPSTSNPKRRNHRRSKQPFILEESSIDTIVDQRTMAELLRALTEGYAEAIVVPSILAEQFELKHSLINMMTSNQFFGIEKDIPYDHIPRRWLENEPSRSIHTWKDLVFKFINEFFLPSRTTNHRNEISNLQQRFDESFHEAWDRYKDLLCACPHHGFTELHQLGTVCNALNPVDQDSLNAAAGGNLLERRTQDVLTIIKNKSKVCNSRNKSVVFQVKSCYANFNSSSEIAKLTHAVNQQTSDVTIAMTTILKQFQATSPPASVKAVEETCVTCGGAHPYYQWPGSLPSKTVANPKGELKAITTRSGISLDGPTVPTPPPFTNLKEDERVEETLTDPDLAEYTIKVPPPPVQKYKPPSQRDYVLHINITLADAQILMPKYQKMLKAILSYKKKLQELANTPLNENCSAVILKKLPEKLGDPRKFLIPCGFSELKCKALANLGASINLMPLYVWKKLGLSELISTADFVIVDYESDLRVPLILGRPFLRTARALIDVHGEEMILRDGDERLTLNMRHDTSSYSNQPQKESINLINVFNHSSKYFLEDLFSNQPSGNPTFSSHPELTSLEVKDDIFDSEGGNVLPKKLLDLDSTKDLHPPLHVNQLSGSTTYSFSPNSLLEELADELALITFPPKYDDDIQFDVESDLKEIEFLLHQDIDSSLKDSIDQNNLANHVDNFVDSMPEMFTDEHALDYSSLLIFDEYDDDFLEVEFDTKNVYDDPFDSKGEKIKDSKLLIDELDLPCDFLPPSEYDSLISWNFSRVDTLPSTNNEDKVFNPGILIQEKPFEIVNLVSQDKKLAISNAYLVLEDFDPSFYEPLFFKEVPRSKMLLQFSSKNEEKVFKLGIHTSEKVHSSRIPELSHQGYKIFKINQIFRSPMKIFLFSCGKDTHILVVPCIHFYPLGQFKYVGIRSS
uniref:Reverse transcriptase domain-containing protein n=1 Tax=Tanacetum cinerariifolium TaxID=118510 RepID=A0A6L2P8N4_TANCI|nr:reverse transcriptase domain-containing protein [Tanacetum cinerariifolium]